MSPAPSPCVPPQAAVELGLSISLQYFTRFLCKQAGAESRSLPLACRALSPVLKAGMGSLHLLSSATALLRCFCSIAEGFHLRQLPGITWGRALTESSSASETPCGTAVGQHSPSSWLVRVSPRSHCGQGSVPSLLALPVRGQNPLLLQLTVLGRAGLPPAFGCRSLKAKQRRNRGVGTECPKPSHVCFTALGGQGEGAGGLKGSRALAWLACCLPAALLHTSGSVGSGASS